MVEQSFKANISFFQEDLSSFVSAQLVERGICFAFSFEHLEKIDNEPYCQFLSSDKLLRIELYVDSANIVSFFDEKESAICLETNTGHTAVDVSDEFKRALPQVLKGFEGASQKQIDSEVEVRGVRGRWFKLF